MFSRAWAAMVGSGWPSEVLRGMRAGSTEDCPARDAPSRRRGGHAGQEWAITEDEGARLGGAEAEQGSLPGPRAEGPRVPQPVPDEDRARPGMARVRCPVAWEAGTQGQGAAAGTPPRRRRDSRRPVDEHAPAMNEGEAQGPRILQSRGSEHFWPESAIDRWTNEVDAEEQGRAREIWGRGAHLNLRSKWPGCGTLSQRGPHEHQRRHQAASVGR